MSCFSVSALMDTQVVRGAGEQSWGSRRPESTLWKCGVTPVYIVQWSNSGGRKVSPGSADIEFVFSYSPGCAVQIYYIY